MKTLILVNALNNVSSIVYSNHIGFLCETRKQFPNDEFILFTPPRMSIDMARNTAAKQAMLHECDYLMFLDDDVLVPSNTFSNLLHCAADIAAGLVIIRGYPFHVMAFKREDGGLPYFDDLPMVDFLTEEEIKPDSLGRGRPAGFAKVLKDPVTQADGLAAVGFSCALINVKLLTRIAPPFFITGARSTEDIYFCLKAKDFCPDLTMALSTQTQCGHLLHAEPIEYKTIDVFKQFYEDLNPEISKAEQKDRDINYIKRCLESL